MHHAPTPPTLSLLTPVALEQYRGSTGDNGKQSIEQPTNIDQKTVCLTAGGNSGIKGSCLNASGSTTSNTGGITGIGKLPFR